MFPRQRLDDSIRNAMSLLLHVYVTSSSQFQISAFFVRKSSMSSYGCGTNMNSIHMLVDFFRICFPVPLAPSCFWFVVFNSFVSVPRHPSVSFPFRLSHFIVVSWSIGFVCDVTSVSTLGCEYITLRGVVLVSLSWLLLTAFLSSF